jgi:hypothetical protein
LGSLARNGLIGRRVGVAIDAREDGVADEAGGPPVDALGAAVGAGIPVNDDASDTGGAGGAWAAGAALVIAANDGPAAVGRNALGGSVGRIGVALADESVATVARRCRADLPACVGRTGGTGRMGGIVGHPIRRQLRAPASVLHLRPNRQRVSDRRGERPRSCWSRRAGNGGVDSRCHRRWRGCHRQGASMPAGLPSKAASALAVSASSAASVQALEHEWRPVRPVPQQARTPVAT